MPTDNHDLNTPAEGSTDWHTPINANWDAIEKALVVRDVNGNRGSYTAWSDAIFVATDTYDIYFGDGSNWNHQGKWFSGGGGGGSVILDLGDDGSNESSGLVEIATTGDTNNIAGEPSADKLLFDFSKNVPGADSADTANSLSSGALDAIGEIDATLRSGADATLITGTAGTDGNLPQFNVDGDIVDSGEAASDVGSGSGGGTVLDSGSLGTLDAANDAEDFTVTGVSTGETVEIAPPRVTPSSAGQFASDYAYNAVDWSQAWDDSLGQWDVTITVAWDIATPPGDIALDYTIYEGGGGGGSGTSPWTVEADDGASLTAQDLSAITGADGVMYRHNGASSITANGAATSTTGYYVWSATDAEWKTVVAF